MSDENKLVPINLETPIEELSDRILNETDIEQFDKMKNLFDLNMKKKEIIRLNKLNDLQDLTVEEMSNRLQKRSGEFSNQDLLGYFKTIQDSISRSDTSLDGIDVASIKVIQNQLNINMNNEDGLSRESKNKVIEAIRSILDRSTSNEEVIEPVIDIVDSED